MTNVRKSWNLKHTVHWHWFITFRLHALFPLSFYINKHFQIVQSNLYDETRLEHMHDSAHQFIRTTCLNAKMSAFERRRIWEYHNSSNIYHRALYGLRKYEQVSLNNPSNVTLTCCSYFFVRFSLTHNIQFNRIYPYSLTSLQFTILCVLSKMLWCSISLEILHNCFDEVPICMLKCKYTCRRADIDYTTFIKSSIQSRCTLFSQVRVHGSILFRCQRYNKMIRDVRCAYTASRYIRSSFDPAIYVATILYNTYLVCYVESIQHFFQLHVALGSYPQCEDPVRPQKNITFAKFTCFKTRVDCVRHWSCAFFSFSPL